MKLTQWLTLIMVTVSLLFVSSCSAGTEPEQVEDDPISIVADQLTAITPITSASCEQETLKWLDAVGEIMNRLATGGIPPPANAYSAMKTISTVVVAKDELIHNQEVLTKVLKMIPSLWSIGFWFQPVSDLQSVLSPIYTTSVTKAKTATSGSCYQAAVNSTSLMIRFTKDNVFMLGVDDGNDIVDKDAGYMTYLAELVTKLSKQSNFSLTVEELRTYMNSLPSKSDGMDKSAAYPVFVDTSKYAASDIKALQKLVSTKNQ